MKGLRADFSNLPDSGRTVLRRIEGAVWRATLAWLGLYAGLEYVTARLAHGRSRAALRLSLVASTTCAMTLLLNKRILTRAAVQRQAEATAREAERTAAQLEGVLLAGRTMQHHLNNQLALTVGYAELLATDPRLPEELRAMANEAHRGAREAAETLDQLLRTTSVVEESAGAGSVLDLSSSAPTP